MSVSPESPLQISQEGAVRLLTLNRPAALNAFTAQLLSQLRQALEDAGKDSTVRAVLISGAGRAFCAGQDLSDPLIKPEADPRKGTITIRYTTLDQLDLVCQRLTGGAI